MSLIAADLLLRERAGTFNSCLCCGFPFASVGRNGEWSKAMADFQDAYIKEFGKGVGCFDVPQQAHLIHKMQREEGASCLDNTKFFEDKPDGQYGNGLQPGNAPVQPNANQDDVYKDMNEINLKWFCKDIQDILKEDKTRTNTKNYRKEIPQERLDKFQKELADITFPTCVRCNTLMTLQAKSSEIMVALNALSPQWYDAKNKSKSANIRKYRYGLLIRKSVQLAKQSGDEIHDCEWVNLIQLIFLTLASFVKAASIEHDLQNMQRDYFRILGIRRLYFSSVLWMLCKIRAFNVFNVPFHIWHIHYFENMQMVQGRSWRQWLFGNTAPMSLDLNTAKLDEAELHNFMTGKFQRALRSMISSGKRGSGIDVELMPDVWLLCRRCLKETSDANLASRQMQIVESFFPPYDVHRVLVEKLYFEASGLDIDSRVEFLGRYIFFKRMVTTCVFNMPHSCTKFLFQILKRNMRGRNRDRPFDITVVEGEGNAENNIIETYKEFLWNYYEQMLKHTQAILSNAAYKKFYPLLDDYKIKKFKNDVDYQLMTRAMLNVDRMTIPEFINP